MSIVIFLPNCMVSHPSNLQIILELKFKVYVRIHIYQIFYVCSTVFFMKLPELY